MPVNNSVSPPFLDEDGHAFKLHILNSSAKSTHRKNQRFKRKTKFREHDRNIRSTVKIVIPPETSVAVPVLANFPSGSNCLYVEKVFSTNRSTDNVYAPPDSLILKTNPWFSPNNTVCQCHMLHFLVGFDIVNAKWLMTNGHGKY
jgi:hypothetical protein